jgi:hypothetical protein
MRFEAPTRLPEDPMRLCEKSVQGTRAAKAKSGYGTPSGAIPLIRPRKSVKTIISMKGWMTAHRAPNAVCL